MSNIGTLNFLIGGDDKELRKILDDRKKDAIALQSLLSSFKVGAGNQNKQVMDSLKIQEKQLKVVEQQNRAEESKERRAANALILEQRLNNEMEKGVGILRRNAALENDRIASEQRIRTEVERTEAAKRQQAATSARVLAIEQESLEKQRLLQQRVLTEVQRTEAARQRATLVGVRGQNQLNNSIQFTNRTLFNQKVLLGQLSSQLGFYFSVYGLTRFVRELAMVSGEFEKQRLSLAAILQDQEASEKIFGQIKDLAVYSPFNFAELTDYAKQLSAFSIPANELFDTMKRLADISAGLGVDMRRIILAYGQVRSAAVLRGQELRQFTEAGIPLVEELAKKFQKLNGEAITTGDVFDKISNREVPFQMIKEIFEEMTNEGGKFYQMQEIQATSLAGMISNLRDAYDIMLDSIGEANRGLLKGFVGGLVDIMDNWEKYWKILKGIILTYGTYRGTLAAISVATQVAAKAQQAYNLYMLHAAISGTKLGTVIDFLTVKFNNLSKATKIGLVLSAIVAIGYAIKTVNDDANKLSNSLDEIAGNVKGEADASVIALENLKARLKTVNQYSAEYRDIIAQINKQYGDFLPNLLEEKDSLEEIEKKLKGVTEAIYEKARATAYSKSMDEIEHSLGKDLSQAYDKAMKSLTTNRKMGYGQYVMSKPEANRVITEMFDAIKKSPELYKNMQEVEKLISQSMTSALKGRTDKTTFKDLYNLPQLEDMIEGVKEYAKRTTAVSTAIQDMDDKSKALWGTNDNYLKSIDAIKEKYAELDKQTKSKANTTPEIIDKELLKNQENMLTELIEAYKAVGQVKLAKDAEEELNKIKNLKQGWRAELNDALNQTIVIDVSTNFNEAVDEMKKKYKEVKTQLDEQKPLLLKIGFDFKENDFLSPYIPNETEKQLRDSYKKAIQDEKNLAAAVGLFKMTLPDLFTPKEKKSGSKKDTVTDELKRQVELIKNAKKEYDGLRKLMSEEDAYKALKTVPEFGEVKQSQMTDTGYVEYLRKKIDEIEKHITKLGKKNSTTAQNVRDAWIKALTTIEFSEISRKAEAEIKVIEKELSQYKDKFNLYEQLFSITGDKEHAAELAFGDPSAKIESYIDVMKEKLKGLSGGGIYEQLLLQDQDKLPTAVRDMVENIRQAIQEKDFTLKLDMSKIVAEYSTTQEKIDVIHNQYEKKREKARKSGASEKDIKAAIAAYNQAEEEEIRELQEQLLQLTPFYKKLFGDLSEIGYRHLKKLAKYSEEIVSKIANTKNEDGKLTYGKYDKSNPDKLIGYYMPNDDGSLSETIISLREYDKIVRRISTVHKDLRKQNPFDSLLRSFKAYNEEGDDGEKMDNMDIIASKAQDLNAIVQDVTSSLSGMFDALGNGDAADNTAFIGEMVGAASNVAMGIASGNPVQMIQGIVGGITAIAKNHDAKLDKAIKKSQTRVKELKNEYSELQRVVDRQLGAISSGQAKQQIQNLERQKRELESQIRNEQNKKKTDNNAIADYRNQINELNDQIRYFYEDLAGEQFGIKIKDWAKSISDALVDAWSNGEDAAKAFDDTVADIMRNVFKNVLQLQYIEPMMSQLRTYLFGNDGRGGILGDGELSSGDRAGLVRQLASLRTNIDNWKSAWDTLVDAAKQAGINLEENTKTSEDTLSKGIAGVTEDTASLLASYINAMRADLSVQRSLVEKIMLMAENNKDTFALMQADIMRIQINTLATAQNTSRLVEISEDTYSILRRASTSGSGVRFNIV